MNEERLHRGGGEATSDVSAPCVLASECSHAMWLNHIGAHLPAASEEIIPVLLLVLL